MTVAMLNSPACDTMTGAFTGLSTRYRECQQKANLGSPSAPGPRARDRTGRYTTQLRLHMW